MSVALVDTGLQFPDTTIQTTAGLTSFTGTGYTKLPNGLYVQWGTGTTTPGSPSTIYFPTAFPSTCLGVYNTYTNNTGAQMWLSAVTSRSTTSFYILVNIGNTQTMNYTWMAIGY